MQHPVLRQRYQIRYLFPHWDLENTWIAYYIFQPEIALEEIQQSVASLLQRHPTAVYRIVWANTETDQWETISLPGCGNPRSKYSLFSED